MNGWTNYIVFGGKMPELGANWPTIPLPKTRDVACFPSLGQRCARYPLCKNECLNEEYAPYGLCSATCDLEADREVV